MISKKRKYKSFFAVILIALLYLTTSYTKVISNQATVPLSITVHGKLIITDAENDTKSGENPTTNIHLNLTPELSSSDISGKSSIRIRTNLSNWKLLAQRTDESNNTAVIDSKDIKLLFTTQAGSKANPYAGKLISPFDRITNLSQISPLKSTEILIGNSKTSIDKDPTNKNNWFQLTSTYSISPDFFYDKGEWNTIISYNLVSP
jgi:hypothetical protein